jgi:hypothetical protein
MIDVPYCLQFSICSKEKKKMGTTPPNKHIFLIIPEFPGQKKEEKKERKCVDKLHLLVT